MSVYPSAQFLISAAAPAQFPPDQGREVAVAGRSNAGKSSAINAITARRALARTSKTPGRTRLLNFFELAPAQRLVDLPGYGFAEGDPRERDQWAALIAALSERVSLGGLLMVVDARRGLLPADQQLLDWTRTQQRPVHVLLSKADQLNRSDSQGLLRRTQTWLTEQQPHGSAQLFSAHERQGIDEARQWLDQQFRGA